MKKFLVVSIMLITFYSCGNRTPIIGGNAPFIVSEISRYENRLCIYESYNFNSGHAYGGPENQPRIILPCGMFQIGDTIKPVNFVKK